MEKLSAFYHLTKPAAVLRVTGPDAFAFLQSQFSNDLRDKSPQYGLWLDLKGKIQADSFIVRQRPEEFLVVSYDCPAEKIRAHLEAHLIADEVDLRDETGSRALLHCWSKEVEPVVRSLVDILTDPTVEDRWPGRRPYLHGSWRYPHNDKGEAWDFLSAPETLQVYAEKLAARGVLPATAEALKETRIRAGVPAVPVDAGPGDLPQEAGLERDAVSFDKGCYLGQEVMARLKSLGHVNRALWRVAGTGDLPLPAGNEPMPLYAGEVIAGELRSRQNVYGLAMLKKRVITGRDGLSLTPGGEEVFSLKAEDGAADLTLPPISPAGQS
jgi:hypothetical protein